MKKTFALMLLLAGLTLEAQGKDLTWNGSGGHMTWNKTDNNWQGDAVYEDGDTVVFGDTGYGTVSLDGTLAPASVTVNNSEGHDYTFSGSGSLAGSLQFTLTKSGNGTLTINTVNDYKEGAIIINDGTLVWGNADALNGSNHIELYNDAKLDLGGNSLSTLTILFGGNATCSIGNGTINSYIEVKAGNKLSLFGETGGRGTIALNEGSTLDLGNSSLSSVIMDDSASIGNGAIQKRLEVGTDKTLTLIGNLSGDGEISLNNGAKLDLGECVLDKEVNLDGSSAFIGNGTQNGKISVLSDKTLALCGDLSGKGTIYLGDNTTLNLGGYALSKDVSLEEHSTIGNGKLDTDLSVASGKTLTLCGNLSGTGTITMNGSAKLDLGTHTLSQNVSLKDSATITAGNATIKALKTDKEGLLQGLSVSEGLIAGTDRQSSLADGLEISMSDNLRLENLILTDNNRISVGNANTITLNNVTIKISNGMYSQVVSGEYIFLLKDLFHCSVDMTDVTFDASGLTLPQGFKPATDRISFNLGDAKLTDATAGRNITLLMGGYGSQTMSLQDGKPVFTALVPIPEPATGALSLLGLGLLACRRRRK